MKIAGIIFSILFLMLNAVPCCADYCSDEEPVEKHSGSEGVCSPFLSCGNCTGFVLQEEFVELPVDIQPSVSKPEFPGKYFRSEFSENIWQPPKINNDL
ncbi:hypothetical protein [Salinimicrobium soli]|uniref:hypothetical protein n=1 Tax=Salinimicrobium soli TaxID=1254399 RepID=UPI003AAA4CA1